MPVSQKPRKTFNVFEGICSVFTKFNHNGKSKQPNKLARQLDRQGTVYGSVSLVSQLINEIQQRKWNEPKMAK